MHTLARDVPTSARGPAQHASTMSLSAILSMRRFYQGALSGNP